MKKLLFSILIACITATMTLSEYEAFSQEHWVSYAKSVSVEEYSGQNFKYSALVRSEIIDDSASAQLWVRVDTKSGMGFFENMDKSPIRDNQWKKYEIQGIIDSSARRIVFGAYCIYNGSFYYDNLKLEVETANNNWETIFNTDFEGDTAEVVKSIQQWGNSNNEKFYSDLLKEESGNQCMLIVGKNVPNFGINNQVGRFATVNGIQMYYEVYGEGKPLVVLHGNGGSISYASSHYPYFIDNKYQIIAIDSRAQGRSGDTEEELTYTLMASDVNELLNHLDLDSVYIWGHSDGAIVGIIMALNYPTKVSKLIAFAPNIQSDTNAILPEIYQWIEDRALTAEGKKEKKTITMMLRHPNISFSELSKIRSEVLIISGDRDFAPLSHTIRIFESIPKAQLCIIPGATHDAAWEKKNLFLQLASDFYEKPFNMPSTIDLLY